MTPKPEVIKEKEIRLQIKMKNFGSSKYIIKKIKDNTETRRKFCILYISQGTWI
jgi:hypothetical protein